MADVATCRSEETLPYANAIVVRQFLNSGTEKPVSLSEFAEFWKTVTIPEREDFGRQAKALLAN